MKIKIIAVLSLLLMACATSESYVVVCVERDQTSPCETFCHIVIMDSVGNRRIKRAAFADLEVGDSLYIKSRFGQGKGEHIAWRDGNRRVYPIIMY